ncbi:MAG TPA: PAS domain-containing protein [Clostridia bacterium]|nr:PAS domain-containing protein [Clostridia bacterium]
MKDKGHNLKEQKQEAREQEITERLNVYHEEIYFQNKELLRAQEELEKSKNSYQELFNNAPAAYVIYSSNNELIKSNAAFSAIVGLMNEEILGESITDYIDQEDQDNFYFHKKNVLKGDIIDSIYLTVKGNKVIAVSNLIKINDENHIKTIFIELPK